MNTLSRKLMPVLFSALAVAVTAGCASKAGMPDDKMMGGKMMGGDMMSGSAIRLSGSQEVPPVSTAATAEGTITVAADKSVSGSVMVRNMDALSAHIHEGAAGINGPVIIPLAKGADNTWMVPAGAMLTDGQYASYMAGKLYVNVHSAAHPNGEIRAQLQPK